MLRFIFVCMGIVALSVIAIGAQFMTDGLGDATNAVMARNAGPEEQIQAIALEDSITPEALNAIETAAGAVEFNPNDTFSGGFTNEAPKALADEQAPLNMATPQAMEESAN